VVGQTKQVNMTFHNQGLIAAENTRLTFDTHPFYAIEPLIGDIGRIPAKASLTIPVTLRRIGSFDFIPGQVRSASSVPCGMGGNASWNYECGPFKISGGAPVGVSGVRGDCGGGSPGGGWTGWGGGGGGLGGGGGVGPGYSSSSISTSLPCDAACWILAIAGCIPGPVGCFFAGFSCSVGFAGGVTFGSLVDCAISVAGCLIPAASIPACAYSLLSCYLSSGSGGPLSVSMAAHDPAAFYGQGLRVALNVFNELTGAPDGVWLHPGSDATTGDWFSRFQLATSETSEESRTIAESERSNLLSGVQPAGVPLTEVTRVIDRWNRTLENVALGILRPADAPPGANLDFIDTIALQQAITLLGSYQEAAEAEGYTDPINAMVEIGRTQLQEPHDAGVCARVKIKLDQQAVLSREAFRATLDIDNGMPNALEAILVSVQVTDGQGHDANSFFGIRPPELTGLSDVNGGGRVAGGAKGTARWTLVPTVDAAPLEPTVYYVGGEFRYLLNGMQVAIPLSPVPITVNPTARMTLDYFHQRDVYADDPFTDRVEPSIPFSLAVMVNNWGAGAARNFRITSAQPEIVENEKGLLIDFKILATEVAGQNMTPTLTANFGTIGPGGISVARWLLTSTLQGLFINYSATFEHLDGQGNPRLSLIDEVRIHEMIRLVQAAGAFEDGKPDFLVNDHADLRDLPDTLWMSDGSSNAVAVVTNATVIGTLSPSSLQVQLTAEMPPGWVYLRVPDPADGLYQLVGVTRSDNQAVVVDTNAWITDRTFLGQGKRPRLENTLHLLDHDSTGQYTLTYTLLPAEDNLPPISSVESLPERSHSAFLVRWEGDDTDGSGIATFDVYYSDSGGPFQRWLTATPARSAVFQGAMGKTYAFYSVAIDQAGNREATPAAPQAQTTVALENRSPVFAALTDPVIVTEGQTVALTVSATDPDGDTVIYESGAGSPPGLVLNRQSGQLTWITTEAQGPSTNRVRIIARDTGSPSASATLDFDIIVLEVNTPPILEPIASLTLSEGQSLSIATAATDLDLPAQALAYRLADGAPAGASVHPTTGIFTWRPTEFQGGDPYPITVIVADNGQPSLSASQTFVVTVLDTKPDFHLALGTTAVAANGAGAIPLDLESGAPLGELTLTFDLTSNRLTGLHLTNLAAQAGPANIVALGENRYRAQFASRPGQLLQGTLTLARLGFAVQPAEHSDNVLVRGESLTGIRTDGQDANGDAGVGRVFVVGREPILDLVNLRDDEVNLVLYALPGQPYAIDRRLQVGNANDWVFEDQVAPTELRTVLPPRSVEPPSLFFRARTIAGTPALNIHRQGDWILIEWPMDCVGCILLQSPAVAGPLVNWVPFPTQPEVINDVYRVRVLPGQQPLFLRLRRSP